VALRAGVFVNKLLELNRAWYLPKLRVDDKLREGTQLLLPDNANTTMETGWRITNGTHLGKLLDRRFGRDIATGRIVAYMPAGGGVDEPALWHVSYDDGDEEDLEEEEVGKGFILHAAGPHKREAGAADQACHRGPSLPSNSDGGGAAEAVFQCVVCTEYMYPTREAGLVMLQCSHVMHLECLRRSSSAEQGSDSKQRCPLCRKGSTSGRRAQGPARSSWVPS